jgi:hypothetical protein
MELIFQIQILETLELEHQHLLANWMYMEVETSPARYRLGQAAVNSNSTKFFIKNDLGNGKNWALSAGANSHTEEGFHLYNWTDNP